MPTNIKIPTGLGTIATMVTTNSNIYVLSNLGQVWAAGGNSEGQLGNGHIQSSGYTNKFSKVDITFPTTDPNDSIVTLASVGPDETMMAIDKYGNVFGWGWNSYDQLCETSKPQPTPVELSNLTEPVSLAAGAGDHATYEYTDGTLVSCGKNTNGELGDGSTSSKKAKFSTPQQVAPIPDSNPGAHVTALVASWKDEGAIMSDGTLWEWGYNKYGQLGDGSTNDSDTPMQAKLPLPAGITLTSVSEGGGSDSAASTMAVLSNNTYYAWGDDENGQLCDGISGPNNDYDTPMEISPRSLASGTITPTQVAAGGDDDTGYLLGETGTVYACGNGESPNAVAIPGTVSVISSTNYVVAALVGEPASS
jgi:alpha-tubulin suppressor-like RCC1 family protein